MHADRTVHLALDLEVRGEEVRGRVRSEGRPPREFRGWLGLIAALDALVLDERDALVLDERAATPGGEPA